MRNLYFLIVLSFISITSSSQSKIEKLRSDNLVEGARLYASEMASWYGSDLFMAKYQLKNNVAGYFSYVDNNIPKCVFFSRGEIPKVIGTVSFDKTYNTSTAETDLGERDFSRNERELYEMRANALAEINRDTIYKQYENTNLNLIPIISNGQKKVYVLTGPTNNGVVIFGNDYLLTFDEKNNFTKSRKLHANIIVSQYGNVENDPDNQIVSSIHSHLPSTGEILTATDICTAMLYGKITGWKTIYVISKDYVSIWDCKSNDLTIMKMKAWKRMGKEIEKNNAANSHNRR